MVLTNTITENNELPYEGDIVDRLRNHPEQFTDEQLIALMKLDYTRGRACHIAPAAFVAWEARHPSPALPRTLMRRNDGG